MCLHTGMTDAYVWDLDTPQERVAGVAETRQILGEVDAVFRRQIGHLLYSHKVCTCNAFAYWMMTVTAPNVLHAAVLKVSSHSGSIGHAVLLHFSGMCIHQNNSSVSGLYVMFSLT